MYDDGCEFNMGPSPFTGFAGKQAWTSVCKRRKGVMGERQSLVLPDAPSHVHISPLGDVVCRHLSIKMACKSKQRVRQPRAGERTGDLADCWHGDVGAIVRGTL